MIFPVLFDFLLWDYVQGFLSFVIVSAIGLIITAIIIYQILKPSYRLDKERDKLLRDLDNTTDAPA